jgi:hypothetical protein
MGEFLRNYMGNPMARDSKKGRFFLPEKRFQSQYGDCTTQSEGEKTFENEFMTFRRWF